MTAETYRIFQCVADEGSISKAADQLFVSQPAVSKAIKKLEEQLGVILFIRMPRGVALTEEGKALYSHVDSAFKQLTAGEKLMRQFKEMQYGTVRVGVSTTLCQYFFMPYLRDFHHKYPALKIEIINRRSAETVQLLEEGLLDCAVISEMTFSDHLTFHPLMEIHDIFVGKNPPPQSELALESMTSYPMLLLEKDNATRQHLDRYLQQNNVSLNVDIEISNMAFLIEFAQIGLGLTSVIKEFIPAELAAEFLFEWPVTPPIPPRSVGLLYKQETLNSIASTEFIQFMLP